MSLRDPLLVDQQALSGITVGLSASDSADLARLGLVPGHAGLLVAELARAILLAGGSIAYGGWLRPEGVTQLLIDEVERFAATRHCLTLYIAHPEHCSLDRARLVEINGRLGVWGELVTLDEHGQPIDWRRSTPVDAPQDEKRAAAYSAHRQFMASNTDARVLVGGKLRGYSGSMPGLIEEAAFSAAAQQPLYLAAGFGGATTAIASALGFPVEGWVPPGLPEGIDDGPVQVALSDLSAAAAIAGWDVDSDGLSSDQRAQLTSTHRPGEVASLCVLGLANLFGRLGES